MKNWFFSIVFSFTLVTFGQVKSPNLIVIMADDLGYQDVGFNGCKDIPTPNIDKIASNGVKFTNGYTSYSVCGPSRAGFITGRYQQRFGFERNPQYRSDDPNMGLPKTEITIAEYLKTVGYTSGIIGKWHLGSHISNHPLNRGFDEFFGHLGGGHQYLPHLLTIKDGYFGSEQVSVTQVDGTIWKSSAEKASYKTWIMKNHKPIKTTKYLTEEFSDAAINFVEKHKEAPFFLFLSYNAPHGPLQATEKYLERFQNIKDQKRKTYAAMVSALDDGVGLVLDKLKELKLEDNTIIIFLSDNGGPESKNASNNGILRGAKGSVYEGGYRVPFALQWKGQIKPQVYNAPVSSLDILSTIAYLAKIKIKDTKPLDGINLLPYLKGDKTDIPHQNIYLRKFDKNQYVVRNGDLKLIVRKNTSKKELYNLNKDISETKNLANQYPDEVNRLNKLIETWDSQLIEPTFLGLVHTNDWKKKKNKKKK